MKTRCSTCGIWYSRRQIGETCGDRSTGIKRLVRGEADRVIACPGWLVRPEDWKFYPNRDKKNRL